MEAGVFWLFLACQDFTAKVAIASKRKDGVSIEEAFETA
jgi:hypothetical protein